jgi:tetratricopeptide (TPR) repeat protein
MDSESCCSRLRCCFSACRTPRPRQRVNSFNNLLPRALTHCFPLKVMLLLLLLCVDSLAQVSNDGSRRLLHGSILTAQGQPAAEVTVEIRDLQGVKVGSGVTDRAGNFEISGQAAPGEYVFVAVSAFRVRDERILLGQPDLEANLALPADVAKGTREGYTVSAQRLRIPTKAWAHLAAADRDFRKMDFDEAKREVDGALQADPACARAFSMRAFIKLADKNSLGALEDAKRAALLDPDDAESFIALAMAYNSLKEFHRAEEAVAYALSLHPDCWQGRLELAKSFYGEGEFIRALCELDSANIDFPDAHLVRGNVLIGLRRNQEAREEFDTFLREAPHDPRKEQIHRVEVTLPPPDHIAKTSDQ